MVFSSLLFMSLFLPISLLTYYIVPQKFRNLVLFVVSLIFYAWGEPIYVLIMIFSTIVDYSHGLLLEKYDDNEKMRKLILLSSCVINLGLLCFFKYSDFLITNINSLLGTSIKTLKLALPIGISFYTFQTMSYTIDVYRRQCKVQHNIINFGAYVSMFPQLIAGPIVRYVDVAEKLDERYVDTDEIADGIYLFTIGLGKKILLANAIGSLWDSVYVMFLGGEISILSAWLGIVAYAMQIYFDFSGYSDMAIGLGHMMGFTFPPNFDHPYLSRSITEFWRRWHISLGTWFKEYVYIPLGGNRRGQLMWLRNLFIVWFLTGLWHGAAWNFIGWGLYFGVILCIEKLFLLKILKKLPSVVSWAYTFFLVLISWCFFSTASFGESIAYISNLFSGTLVDNKSLYLLSNYGVLFVVIFFANFPVIDIIEKKLSPKAYALFKIIFIILVLIICLAYIVTSGYNPFLYFRF